MTNNNVLKITIRSSIPDLNQYISIGRSSNTKLTKSWGNTSCGAIVQNQKKQSVENSIMIELSTMPKLLDKQYVLIVYYEQNHRKDDGNVKFKQKFIFDAMQKKGKIINDGRNYIVTLFEPVLVDKDNPRIEVYMSADKVLLAEIYMSNYFVQL